MPVARFPSKNPALEGHDYGLEALARLAACTTLESVSERSRARVPLYPGETFIDGEVVENARFRMYEALDAVRYAVVAEQLRGTPKEVLVRELGLTETEYDGRYGEAQDEFVEVILFPYRRSGQSDIRNLQLPEGLGDPTSNVKYLDRWLLGGRGSESYHVPTNDLGRLVTRGLIREDERISQGHQLSPQAIARLLVSSGARELSDLARASVASVAASDFAPGQLAERTMAVYNKADQELTASVVAAVVNYASWEGIAWQLDSDYDTDESKRFEQALRAKYQPVVVAFKDQVALANTMAAELLPREFRDGMAVAKELDRWVEHDFAFPDTPQITEQGLVSTGLATEPEVAMADRQYLAAEMGARVFGNDIPPGVDRSDLMALKRSLDKEVQRATALASPDRGPEPTPPTNGFRPTVIQGGGGINF